MHIIFRKLPKYYLTLSSVLFCLDNAPWRRTILEIRENFVRKSGQLLRVLWLINKNEYVTEYAANYMQIALTQNDMFPRMNNIVTLN